MTQGIGVDIVDIERIRMLMTRYGDRFTCRTLTPIEYEKFVKISSHKKASFVAKRFAAKEAFSKAIGTGIGGACSFQDFSVVNDESGKPSIILHKEFDDCIKNSDIFISLSDERQMAIAFVVISKKQLH